VVQTPDRAASINLYVPVSHVRARSKINPGFAISLCVCLWHYSGGSLQEDGRASLTLCFPISFNHPNPYTQHDSSSRRRGSGVFFIVRSYFEQSMEALYPSNLCLDLPHLVANGSCHRSGTVRQTTRGNEETGFSLGSRVQM
jgi:hypothetical protein